MINFFIGLLFGFAVSFFLRFSAKGKAPFWQVMDNELALNGQAGSMETMKKKLDIMEKQLLEMENKLQSSVSVDPEPEKKAFIKTVQYKNPIASGYKKNIDRKLTRNEAVRLWHEGKTAEEIACKTNLGKGEIELILSLCSSRQIGSWLKEQAAVDK